MLQQSLALETMIYDNDQGYFGGLSQCFTLLNYWLPVASLLQ